MMQGENEIGSVEVLRLYVAGALAQGVDLVAQAVHTSNEWSESLLQSRASRSI